MRLTDKNIQEKPETGISRRALIKLGLITAASCVIPYRVLASVRDDLLNEKKLFLYNLHTNEEFKDVYWKNGEYIPEVLVRINYMLRDHYNGAVKTIDKKLLDLMFAIQTKLKATEPFHIISGYRSAKTNEYLRKHTKGVAKKSLHILGKAVDLRLPDHRLKDLRRAAYDLKTGGVGYYPKSNFVHIDVGKLRFW